MDNRLKDYDVKIEVVDNGFTAKIGPRTFVFSDLDKLDKWLAENFKSIKRIKKYIREVKDIASDIDYDHSLKNYRNIMVDKSSSGILPTDNIIDHSLFKAYPRI